MRWTKVVALSTIGVMSLAACGNNTPANQGGQGAGASQFVTSNDTAIDMNAKGPAAPVPNAKTGGKLTVPYQGSPDTLDPSAQFFQDVNVIENLVIRRLTTYRVHDGKAVLVPDLAESWEEASDGLSWTFKIKKGQKYDDGTEIKAADFVYGIKRSFAKDELPGGPDYQTEYLKGGTDYKGPWKDKAKKFEGAEATDDYTVKINLEKKWPSLPYFAAFTQMSPIPEAKDTKETYGNKPAATGPYKFQEYVQSQKLVLVKNDQWDPNSDPARHQYVDSFEFKFKQDKVITAKTIMASTSDVDKTSLTWDGVDASVYNEAIGAKKDQVLVGTGSCAGMVNIDVRKVKDLKVRQAIATAWPLDQIRKAQGRTSFDYQAGTTFMVPTVPGFHPEEPLPYATGKGKGDPEKAKALLKEAGAEGYELSWYYSQDNPVTVAANQARKQGLEAAGFKVKDIGKPRGEMRKLGQSAKEPVNLLQGPSGWCFDWPSGDAVYPAIFSSMVVNSGHSSGFMTEKKVDDEMDRIKQLPISEQGAEWSKFDAWLQKEYLPSFPIEYSKSSAIFGTKVRNVVNDPNQGMPDLTQIWVEQ